MSSLFDRLVALLGARRDGPELAALCSERDLALPAPSTDSDASKVTKDDAGGFEIYVTHRIAHRRFVPPRTQGRAYVCYVDRILLRDTFAAPLPFGVTRASSRAELVAALGEPARTNAIGEEHFEKELGPDARFFVSYRPHKQQIRSVWLMLPTGWVLDSHPLHFQTEPPEGKPAHASTLATGLLLAWAANRFGLAPSLAALPRAAELARRAITGRDFLVDELAGTLLSTDLDPRAGEFLHAYVARLFDVPDEAGRESISYDADYLASFAGAVPSPFLVPDSWEAFDRLAPILDARWQDYQETRFQTPAPAGLYEGAAAARDAVVVPVTTPAATPIAVAADTTDRLMAIVGRGTTEPDVKKLLVALGLPVGTTIDKQALPRLGVSYMATRPTDKSKLPAGLAKKAVLVESVGFHASGTTEYVRGLGAQVAYLAYAGPLPRGLAFADDRGAVHAKLGAPATPSTSAEWWDYPELERRIVVRYDETTQRVTQVAWGMPAGWAW